MSSDWLLAVADLVLVVAVARAGGWLACRLRQPRIAGELVAVVAIGPTVLGGRIEGVVAGASATGTVGALFPPAAVSALTWAGGLGLILYMLLVGIAIDPGSMRRRGGAIAALSAAIVAPTAALATAVALWLAHAGGWTAAGAATSAFVLLLVGALIAHGLPIVGRILEERGLLRSDVGLVTIAAGACVTTVALVLSGIAVEGGDAGAGVRIVATLVAGGAVVALAVAVGRARRAAVVARPPRAAAVARTPRVAPVASARRSALPAALQAPAIVACALAAGIAGKALVGTALLGPLVVGVLVGGASDAAARIEARLGAVTRGVLLPLFLGVAALHVDLRELGASELPAVAAILAAVIAVKVVAGSVTARAAGFAAGDARAIGALLQCGGIITIAISLDGLQAGVVSTRTHALLTLVAGGAVVALAVAVGRARRAAVVARPPRAAAVARTPRVAPVASARRSALPAALQAPTIVACALAAGVAGRSLIGTALLGPLVVGALVCGTSQAAARIEARLGAVTRGVLLPLFLGVAALHVDLRELGASELPAVAAILAAVIAVKVVAGSVTARAAGFAAGDARAIGALLQCGGIITIAISLDGLQAGVVSTRTHALLTLVGLVTTVVAGPLLDRARPRAGARPPVPESVV